MAAESKFLYEFCAVPLSGVRTALLKLLENRKNLSALWPPDAKFYDYVEFLLDCASDKDLSVNGARRRAIVNFLNPEPIEKLLVVRTDLVLRNEVSAQVGLLFFALGKLTAIKRYDVLDLNAVLKGEFEFYTDEGMAYTLNCLGQEGLSVEEIGIMFSLLPALEDNRRVWRPISREVAIIQSLALHNLWLAFSGWSQQQAVLLFSHYFYLSIIAGVPVLDYLRLINEEGGMDEQQILGTARDQIMNNQEPIAPGSYGADDSLAGAIKKSLAASGSQRDAFTQEGFLNDFYKSERNKSAYVAWLRDALIAERFLNEIS